MKHPDQATLALHAGGDLGAIARWRTERHLAHCGLCRRELAAYRSDREGLAELHSFPNVAWGRLALEMRANIRLGLIAGECVAPPPRRSPLGWSPARLAAFAAGLALAAATVWMEWSGPGFVPASGVVVETTAGGVRLTRGSQAMGLLNRAGEKVTYTAGAQGSVEARYVDTNCVTVNQVDVD
jgi:anti-sigma factor RsiW